MMTFVRSIDVKATGSRIRDVRILNNVKVSALQVFFGFEFPTAIYKWENGESLPTMDNIFGLSDFYRDRCHMDLTVEDLVVRCGEVKEPFRKEADSQDTGDGAPGCCHLRGRQRAKARACPRLWRLYANEKKPA